MRESDLKSDGTDGGSIANLVSWLLMEVGSRRRNMALCNILRLLLSSIAIVFSCYSGYIEGSSIRLQAEERLRREAVPPLFGTGKHRRVI